MTHIQSRRPGATLLEVLIVIGIIGVLLGLLLPAVQKAREFAARISSQNKLKQIILGIHHFAADHQGNLPSVDGNKFSQNKGRSLFESILPYLEENNVYVNFLQMNRTYPALKGFISPADPTFGGEVNLPLSSYAANAQVFNGAPSLNKSFPDGTSNTIAFAEHYAKNCSGKDYYWNQSKVTNLHSHRATFADGGPLMNWDNYGDIYPVTGNANPPVTLGNAPKDTFQVAPLITKCDPTVAQSPHHSGMLISLADGSVRIITPAVAPSIYWGAVTPAGGEILGGDW